MKSYTDLNQSKKLAEILPHESADMFYVAGKGEPIFIGNKIVAYGDDDYDALGGPDVLCWSLGALLNLIPTPTLARLDDKEDGGWYCNTIKFGEDYFSYYGNYHDNPIDACIEVIKWLINNKHIKL